MELRLFEPYVFGERERGELDRQGHFILPGILTREACDALVLALGRIAELQRIHGASGAPEEQNPGRHAAENDAFLASLIPHPDLVGLAQTILGPLLRWDHCVSLNRAAAHPGMRWHSHEYADDAPALGFLRIFFYVNGFAGDDGGLKVVPGSHLFRDSRVSFNADAELEREWLAGKVHPVCGEPLRIQRLDAPPASVVLMWTHALHGVTPRRPDSPTRWTVVYAYRNPGRPSRSRWITEQFEQNPPPGTEQLMRLY
jgi:hypothetical protein